MVSFNKFSNIFRQKILLSKRQLASALIAAIVLAPLIVVLSSVFSPTDDVWDHLVDTVLGELVMNTFWLILGVGAGTAIVGTGLAWLTVVYDFPGRKIFDWALVLPLAIPAYVIAFVSIGLLDFTGPVQTTLRNWLGTQPMLWFPKIRTEIGDFKNGGKALLGEPLVVMIRPDDLRLVPNPSGKATVPQRSSQKS